MPVTGDQSFLRQINRTAMIRLVRGREGLSRADIAKMTGLTKSTVSLLIQELMDEGWLCEEAIQVTGSVGRRPTPLALDGSRLALIGADIGCDFLNVLVCNLKGERLYSQLLPFTQNEVDARLDALLGLIAEALASVPDRQMLGLGVGVPGILSPDGLRLVHAPNLAWSDLDLHGLLGMKMQARGIDLPLYLVNESNGGALAESVFTPHPDKSSLVFLSMGVGLGGGVVLNDRLYVGHDGYAGELGHTVMQIDGPLCACGRLGCAETFVSQSGLSRLLGQPFGQVLPVAEIATLLAGQDTRAQEAVTLAGRYLGALLQNVANTIDPDEIILGGPLVDLGAPLIQTALESLRANRGRFDTRHTPVRVTAYGMDACALGAAALVFYQLLLLE